MGLITDLLTEVGQPGSATTLSSPGKAIGASNVNVGSTANWPSVGKKVYFAIRVVDPTLVSFTSSNYNPSGVKPGTYTEWMGIVGTNSITNLQIAPGSPNADQTYTAGTNTQVFIPIMAARENALVTWGSAEHNLNGTHAAITPTSVTTPTLTVSTTATLPANTGTTTFLADSAVTPAKLLAGTGTSWPYQTWTPTWTGITIGNSTVVAKYVQTGKKVDFHISVTLGSTFVMASSGDTSFTLPPIAVIGSGYFKYASILGRVGSNHGGTIQLGSAVYNNTTTALLVAETVISATSVMSGWNSASVGSATGDTWGITGTYEAA